jgi:hypothetical protein
MGDESIYGDFDTNNVTLDSIGLPVGEHLVMITAEERAPTKAGNGDELLKLTFQCVEGEFKGKSIIQRYNLWNSNPTASNIAKQEIKRISEATGRPANAENPLKGRLLKITVRNQKGNDQYTEIGRYNKAD